MTSYGYDADDNQTSVTDARGNQTTSTYNADDLASVVTDPDHNSQLTCYDGSQRITETVPAVGVAANTLSAGSCPTSYPADYGQRLASDATTYSYDAAGDLTQQTTPAPAGQTGSETTSYTYDADGDLLTTTAPPIVNGGSNQSLSTPMTPWAISRQRRPATERPSRRRCHTAMTRTGT